MNLYYFYTMYLECGPILAKDNKNASIKKEEFRNYDVESAEPFLDEGGKRTTLVKCHKSSNPIPLEQNVFTSHTVKDILKEIKLIGEIKYFNIDDNKSSKTTNEDNSVLFIDTTMKGFSIGVCKRQK